MKWLPMNILFGVFLTCSFSIHSTRSTKSAFGGYLWEAFIDDSHLYADAHKFCIDSGGWPAEPKTKELNDYLTTLVSESSVKNTKGHYIGLTKIKRQTIWRWSNGDEALWTNWKANAGDKGDDNLCAAILPNGQWNDVFCNTFNPDTTRSYACQWDLDQSDANMTYGGYYWERFETEIAYSEAQTECLARGGWLAEPRNAVTNTVLRNFLNSGSEYFIGLRYITSAWYWRGNSYFPNRYNNWDNNEGSGGGGQHCAMMKESSGKWYDVLCDQTGSGGKWKFVCQTPLPNKGAIFDNYLLEAFNAEGNYQDEKSLCTARDQWAVEPKSQELNDALKSIIDSGYNGGYFIGLTTEGAGVWKWGGGDSLGASDYENWHSGPTVPPSSTTGCTVIVALSPWDGAWKDVDCGGEPRRFSCQSLARCVQYPNTCKNGATCTSTETDPYFTCDCKSGFYGETCADGYCEYSEHTDPCDQGTCVSDSSDPDFYTCDCDPGYYGDICDEDHCTAHPDACNNVGVCTSTTTGSFFTCNCTNTGYYGPTCKVEYCNYPEHSGTCKNGAKCRSKPNNDGEDYYKCECTPEYEARNCTEPIFHNNVSCDYHINYNALHRTTFELGMKSCEVLNATLFMDKNSSIHDFITTKIEDLYGAVVTDYWIGGRWSVTNGIWEWIDTTAVPVDGNDSQWDSGKPSSTNGCMQISRADNDYKWFGVNCNTSEVGWICERPVSGMEPCSVKPCSNGTCIATGCQWRCNCWDGYWDERCDKDLIEIYSPNEVIAIADDDKIIIVNVTIYETEPVTIDVYKDGVEIDAQSKTVTTNGSVKFTFLNISNSSEGSYEFTAYPLSEEYKRESVTKMTVHVRAHIETVDPSFIFSPVTNGSSEIVCEADGIPTPSIGWYRNDTLVSNTTGNGVYQTMETDNAKLHIESALLEDDGKYTCRATNEVGEGDEKENVTREQTATLAVYGDPAILSTSPSECTDDATISIQWAPNGQTQAVRHRFHIASINWTEPYGNSIWGLFDETAIVEFSDLQPYTEYNISIEVCPDYYCLGQLYTSDKVTTGHGTPGVATNVTLDSQIKCSVTWDWPSDTPADQIEIFQVTWTSVYDYKPPDVVEDETIIEVTIEVNENSLLQHTIETVPNRRYTATIVAKTCAGMGESVVAPSCVTESEPPEEVPTLKIPETNDRVGTRDIKIQLANETNGGISCTLVIVSKGGNMNEDSITTVDDLQPYQDRATSQKNLESGYLAVAVQRIPETKPGELFDVTLGDTTTTVCDMYQTLETSARQNREVHLMTGNNIKLEVNAITYSVTTVTTIPTDSDMIIMKQGTTQTFVQGTIVPIVVPSVIIPVAILLLVAGFVVYRKRYALNMKRDGDEPVPHAPNGDNNINLADLSAAEGAYENVTIERKRAPIQLTMLERQYAMLKRDESMRFREEYQELKREAKAKAPSWTFGSRESIMVKNRYKNIIPYDRSRVELNGDARSGYINACYVHRRRFIAAQGPLPNTVNDFWRMVVEKKCRIIVMLTKCDEAGRKKCEKYWPNLNQAVQHGAYNIRNHNEKNFGGYVKRELRIYNLENEEHVVEQYQFLHWPDHGVPKTTSSFFRFYRNVMKSGLKAGAPILVHCSAGVGRTGTLIGYHILQEEMKKKNSVDIYRCVMEMRSERVDMVQTADQYELLHRLLLETYLFGDTDVSETELEKRKKKDKRAPDKEFENLSVAESLNTTRKVDESSYIPGSSDRVVILRQAEDTEWISIDATFLEAYNEHTRLIAAQAPQKSTVEYFWRAIYDNDVDTVVMLNNLEGNQTQCAQYWPNSRDEPMAMISTTVRMVTEDNVRGIVHRKFRITRAKGDKEVMQYQFLRWSAKEANGLIDLLGLMEARHGRSTTIMVHCSNGLGRTGVFCTLFNVVDRLQEEKRIDVFRTVKDFRDIRSGMVQTLGEYLFCYEVASTYIASRNVYENCAMEDEEPNEPIYQNV